MYCMYPKAELTLVRFEPVEVDLSKWNEHVIDKSGCWESDTNFIQTPRLSILRENIRTNEIDTGSQEKRVLNDVSKDSQGE